MIEQEGCAEMESGAACHGAASRLTVGRVLALVAVVLFAGFVFVALGTRPVASWQVLEVRDSARVHLTRGRFRPRGLQVGEVLEPTVIVTDRNSEVVLRLDGLLALRLSPDSTLDLPAPPAHWIGRHRRLFLEGGEVALTSWDRMLGDRVTVATEALVARLEGADLVVRHHPDVTEIFLLRGAAELTMRGGDIHRLEGLVGMRFASDAPPETIPVDERARELAETLPRAD